MTLPSWDRCLVVAAGAALGGIARYAVSVAAMARFGGTFPLGTMAVNLSGCFLIGLSSVILTEWIHQPHPYWRLFLVVGVLGGYTTFSSFEYETWLEFRDGSRLFGWLNIIGSVLLGYLAVILGVWLARLKYRP